MVANLLINEIDYWVNFIMEMELPKSCLTMDYFMNSRVTIMQVAHFCSQYYAKSNGIIIKTVSLIVVKMFITESLIGVRTIKMLVYVSHV